MIALVTSRAYAFDTETQSRYLELHPLEFRKGQAKKGMRGYLEGYKRTGKSLVTLFSKKSDINTLIHEVAGYYFTNNLMFDWAEDLASDQMKKDWASVLEFLDMPEDTDWTAVLKQPREHNSSTEKLARAAEEYF